MFRDLFAGLARGEPRGETLVCEYKSSPVDLGRLGLLSPLGCLVVAARCFRREADLAL